MKNALLYLGLALVSVITGCSKMTFNRLADDSSALSKDVSPGKKKKGPTYIDGAYVVIFKKDIQNVNGEVEEMTKKLKFKTKHRYKSAIKGFAGQLTPEMIEVLQKDPRVAYIEQDQMVSVGNVQSNPPSWGLDRIDQKRLPLDANYSYSSTASNVDVYIFDTGIRLSHEEFGGRAIMGYDGYGWQGPSPDGHGHGTHVAGIVAGNTYGIAKGARLIAVRVLGSDGFGSWSEVAAGIDWATSHHTDNLAVGNLSLGSGGSVRFVEDAIRQAVADGITMCLAAGNEGMDAQYFTPAKTREGITVGASDVSDQIAGFSNYGSVVDIFAPGVGIQSAYHSSDDAAVSLSGTSMAAPHVAGAAAVYLANHPFATPADVENGLKTFASSNMLSGIPPGTINLLLNLDFSQTPAIGKPFQVSLKEPGNYNGNVSTNPIFSWYSSTSATAYELQISQEADFNTLEYQREDITGCYAAGFSLANNVTYYWRVKASNTAGSSEWSETWSLIPGTNAGTIPYPNIPENAAVNVTVPATISWYCYGGARAYSLQISTDASFKNIIYRNPNVIETSTIVKTLQSNTEYFWRVNANYLYMSSPWSETRSFRTR